MSKNGGYVFPGKKKIVCDEIVMFLSGVHDEERTILIHLPEDYAHYYPGMRNKAAGELHLAIKNFSKAIDIEEPSLEPYSERIIMSKIFFIGH